MPGRCRSRKILFILLIGAAIGLALSLRGRPGANRVWEAFDHARTSPKNPLAAFIEWYEEEEDPNPFITGRHVYVSEPEFLDLGEQLADPFVTTNKTVDVEDLRPGLVNVQQQGDISIMRLEPTIALALKAGESPHPRFGIEANTISWKGYLNVLRPGNYRFSAMLRGHFRLLVAGKEMLTGDVRTASPQLVQGDAMQLEAGILPIVAKFTRYSGPARLELFWQAPHFRMEPLPYDSLFHLPAQETDKLRHDKLIERGRFLAEEYSCARCHQPDDKDRLAKGLQARQGPDLSQVGQRVYSGWLLAWLESPQKLHPGAVMPQLFSDDEVGRMERNAVARYLTSLGRPIMPDAKQPKPKELETSVKRGERLFSAVGCVACHGLERGKGEKLQPKPAEAARALVNVSKLFPLQGLGSKTTPEKLAAYLANPLAIDPSGRMPHMNLTGDEARDLARYLCQAKNPEIMQDLPAPPPREKLVNAFRCVDARAEELAAFERLPADSQLVDLGKRLVMDKGCNNCHTIAPGGKAFANMMANAAFNDMKQERALTKGCLADKRSQQTGAPWFGFAEEDRKALRLFLRDGTKGAGSPAPTYAARVALERFNCLACHSRDGAGGLMSSLTEELRRVEKAENSEAITPPPLTGVGHKLRTSWMKQVLTQAGRARPWMGLRMPQFGEANVGWLPEALTALDGAEPDNKLHKVALSSDSVRAGRQLVGKGGFGCISCHDIAGIPNTGTRGPDLALMDQRVRFDWYTRWLEQAQRMQPGTRMPSVFTDGKSLLTQILGGSAEAQAEAMWAYLSLGKNLPLPEGLEPPKGLVLAVKDRPIMLRTFMPEAGARAMAVGYTGNVAIAFDMARCRLAYAWSGNFLDAAPVWNDRGGNPAKVLGAQFWTAPPGCPWALHTSLEPPDFAAQSKDAAYGAELPEGQVYQGPHRLQFDGYSVDKLGLPSFHYHIQADGEHVLKITEQPGPLRSTLAVGVSRHFMLTVPAATTAWLFAARAIHNPRVVDGGGTALAVDWKSGRVEFEGAGRRLILPQDGDRVAVLELTAAPGGASWLMQQVDGHWQALLRFPAKEEKGEFDIALNTWVLPRDEPALLKELLHLK